MGESIKRRRLSGSHALLSDCGKYAFAAHKNYYLGLVYSRIGEVYSEQMNFNGALEYYRNAYGAWENYASLRL